MHFGNRARLRMGLAVLAGLFLALAAPAAPVFAQDKAELPTPVIAVIDIQEVLSEAKASQGIREQRDMYMERFQKEFAAREDDLRREDQELAKQRTLLSPEAFADKRKAFEEKVAQFQRDVQERRQALEVAFKRAMAQLQENLIRVTDEIAQEKQANIVLVKSQVLLFDNKMEITDQALARLNERLPAVDFPKPQVGEAAKTE